MSDKPNILLLFPDQHRPDWMPHNAALPLRMPTIERLAAGGVRFTRAYTPSPLCAPARACLAAGRAYDDCGVPSNGYDYPLDQETVYQRLRAAGYEVAGVGKFDLHKATRDWGLDGSRLLDEWGFTRGIDNEGKLDAVGSGASAPMGPYMSYLHEEGLAATHVEDFRRRGQRDFGGYASTHATPLPEEAYCDNWIAQNALSVLGDIPVGRPWYLAVNFAGPHDPVDVTERMRQRWCGEKFPPPVDNDQLDAGTHQRIRQNYAAMLENIDFQCGRILDLVQERGELENTIVIYSSDHGEMLGDHNRWTKSIYYQPSMGIPLVVSGPGVRSGVTCDALVGLQDLTATFLDTAGAPSLPAMEGRSVWPVLRGDTEVHRRHGVSALGKWRAVTDGRYKLVQPDMAAQEYLLFDLHDDPDERANVAAGRPDLIERLIPLLAASPQPHGKGEHRA